MIETVAEPIKIALVGNPNSGKSTIFNQLTGLRQKTGNFPGVTVDIKKAAVTLPNTKKKGQLIDLPGTYSLYPTGSDEKIVAAVLTNPNDPFFPDAILYIADVIHLEKHLLLFTQVLDLGLPTVLVLNMSDVAEENGVKVNLPRLSEKLGVPVIAVSGRSGDQLNRLLPEIEKLWLSKSPRHHQGYYQYTETEKQVSEAIRQNLGVENTYRALLIAHHYSWLPFLSDSDRAMIATIHETKSFQSLRSQVDETLDRFDRFTPVVRDNVQQPSVFPETSTDHIDAILTHRVWGPLAFVLVMLLVFQAIFEWSSYPMDMIESGFNGLNHQIRVAMGDGWLSSLVTDGILSGLSGILVFVPQIAILFLLITILEEVGYMARVVFMFDHSMRRFGMNGRSVVALISGGACAVPAIMSSRTIGNWQERLITIMVTPFISCSARLPVYAVLIGLAVPSHRILGFLNVQTLTLAAMYALGVVAALGSGYLMKKYLGRRDPSFLAIQLPVYRMPQWKNVAITVLEKVKAFVMGAGKIIIIISLVLWVMANFGPGNNMANAMETAQQSAAAQQLDTAATNDLVAAYRLEASWAGSLGKFIEPAIRPLGYDWKIGIALITSFAAREVFVGTMSTIYSIGSTEDEVLLREKMKAATWADSGAPVYTLATAISLLVFYALAMQCMSTIAVVKRETGSWKWALFQFIFMSLVAYLGAWAAYLAFS